MKHLILLVSVVVASVVVAGHGSLAAEKEAGKPPLRVTVELTDGSRVVGVTTVTSLAVRSESLGNVEAPLQKLRLLSFSKDHESATLSFENGDSLKGSIDIASLPLETLFGNASVGVEHIRELRVMDGGAKLPAGEGPVAFGGVNWTAWRTAFEVQGDKLVSLPKARPGFNYGHGGHGRGPVVMTNIGSADWRDYSTEFDYCMTGVNPALNPHALPLDYRAGIVMFHVTDAKESWNERGASCYGLFLQGDGEWHLRCIYNDFCAVPSGYGNPTRDGERTLAKGRGLNLNKADGNRFRIDVCGTRIQLWVDGEQIVDVRDDNMGQCIGGQTLDHGGIGFHWGMDSMGWIRNFSTKRL